jgi:hypothetical protein
MSSNGSHSLVLASDYRVRDVSRIRPALERWRPNLAGIGAHHVVVYASKWDPGRVLVTIGIRQKQPIRELLRSRVIFEWFDDAGLEDIPAVFAGEIVEKFDTNDRAAKREVAGTIVAALSSVDDVAALLAQVHGAAERLSRAGVRKIWLYQAFDDQREVMILQELDDEEHAQQWVDHPDTVAQWMLNAGSGPYPPPFVGSLSHVMTIDATSGHET